MSARRMCPVASPDSWQGGYIQRTTTTSAANSATSYYMPLLHRKFAVLPHHAHEVFGERAARSAAAATRA